LGHFGVLFAKALGANVTAITHSDRKMDDIKALGADKVIVTGDDAKAACKDHARSLDLIVCTSNDPKLPLAAFINLIRPGGTFVLVGAAEADSIPKVSAFNFITTNVHFTGSAIGSPTTTIPDMLKFAAEKGVKPWIKKYDMKDVNEAIPAFERGEPRYRFVLVNPHHGGQL